MELALLATVVLSVSAPARTVVINVGGEAAAPSARALESAVEHEKRLQPVDIPEDVRQTLLEPFDPAADQAPARALYDIARKRYGELAYEGALEALLDAEAKARHADPAPSLWSLLTDIHVLLGVVHTARGDDDQAVASFRMARTLDPKLKLDPAYYPPAMRARFERAAADRRTGQIDIHDPPGALVSIDGVPAGKVPLVKEAVEGEHYVAVEAPGREPRIERVPVVAGKSSHVTIFLARRPVAEEVRALVAAARRRGSLEEGEARRLAALVGADLLLAVDGGRARAYWLGNRPAGLLPPVEGTRLDPLVAALPHDAEVTQLPPPPPPPPPVPKPWYGKWWIWALGGALAAGTTVLAVEAFSSRSTNYQFPPSQP